MPIFVVQEHISKKKHWDFRLEKNKKLKSWAITKIPPKSKSVKRLAIQTPDHAYSYRNFEGEIKKGYGKGKVKIWDKGTYKEDSWEKDKIVFHLKGKKLNGKYVLLTLENPRFSRPQKSKRFFRETNYGKNKNGWLFFRV